MINKRRTATIAFGAFLFSGVGYVIGKSLPSPQLPDNTLRARESLEQARRAQAATDPRLAELPEGPSQWVALSADVRVQEHGMELKERFYRSSDGSRRVETYSPDSAERKVTIHNMQLRTTFYQGPDGLWSSTPLLPSMFMSTARPKPFLSKDLTVQLAQEPYERWTVYRVSGHTDTKLVAPELNYFEVRTEWNNGRVLEYYNIKLEEPSPDLFVPPANASVRRVTTPAQLWDRKEK